MDMVQMVVVMGMRGKDQHRLSSYREVSTQTEVGFCKDEECDYVRKKLEQVGLGSELFDLIKREWPEDCFKNVEKVSESPMMEREEVIVRHELLDVSEPIRGMSERAPFLVKRIKEGGGRRGFWLRGRQFL